MSAVDFSILELLLKAPSKDAVRDVCVGSHRGGNHRLTEDTATTLNISHTEAEQLVQSLHALSHHILFKNLTSAQQVQNLFPEPFHSSLKNLLTKILLESSQTWRSEALSDQSSPQSLLKLHVPSALKVWKISLPRLQSLDWRVDLVSGSESVNRMSTPTCLVTLQMEDGSQSTDLESVSTVTMELSRQTVDTMLDGLGRIRDQLSNI